VIPREAIPILRFGCDCGAALEVPGTFEGRRVRCPSCGAVVRAEPRSAARYELVDAAPAPVPEEKEEDRALQPDLLCRVWADWLTPVLPTWAALIGVCCWVGWDLGATPAQIMFVAYNIGFLFAICRLPRHLGLSSTDGM
jgi:hypothetical protein